MISPSSSTSRKPRWQSTWGAITRSITRKPPMALKRLLRFVHYFTAAFPNFRLEVKRLVAEGDLVMMHSHLVRQPGDRGVAVVDIFRLEEGKIVEHWDVSQEVPEKSANNNSMF